jgi:hypothetical protein
MEKDDIVKQNVTAYTTYEKCEQGSDKEARRHPSTRQDNVERRPAITCQAVENRC